MPNNCPPEFRRQMVELVRAGRTPEEPAKEFQPSAQSIRTWVRQADLDDGPPRPHLPAETTWASAHRAVHPPARSAVGPGEPLRAHFLIHDRDGKFPAPTEELLADVGIQTVLTGIRMPRMNAVMERWVQSCRRELLDRCLLWNERPLRNALREYEGFSNRHRAHQALDQAAPLRAVPDPITDPAGIVDLKVRRRDRLGGVLHEYSHAA